MTRHDRDEDLAAADDRTLRLAAPALSQEKLAAFIAYQRALASRLEILDLTSAHQEAQRDCPLDRGDLSRIEAMARAFCINRLGHSELVKRRAALAARPVRDAEDEKESKLSDAIRAREADLTALGRRYGREAVALLLEREAELLELYEVLGRAAVK
jgi:hypothetical protein